MTSENPQSANMPRLRFPEFVGEWETVDLGAVISLQSGYAFSSELFGQTGVKLVTPKNFTKSGAANFDKENTKFTTEKVDPKFLCKPDDLLVLLTDLTPSCELLGKPLELTEADGEVLLNQRIVRVEPSETKLSRKFLKAFMLTDTFHIRVASTASGTTVRHSSNKVLEQTKLAIPSLPEQKKIAAFLGVVDAKIAGLRAKVEGLETYKRGLMQALFSQTLRFTKPDGTAFPDWEEKKLGDYLKEHRGGAPLTPSDFVNESNFEVIPKKAVGPGGELQLGEDRTFTSESFFKTYLGSTIDSSFLVTTLRDLVPSGPSIGYIVKFESERSFLLAQGVYGFKIEEQQLNPKFLIAFSNTIPFRRRMQKLMVGSTQVHIRNGDFFGQSLLVPHPDEQQKIADALSAMDTKIQAVSAQVSHMESFKKGLLQQMFV
jgi:type I restriction enzyme, S subunit